MPLSYAVAGLNLLGSIVNTQQINDANLKLQQMTNQNNRQLVATQNAYAKQEAELAYKRSSAPNQVNLMRQAGMSRAGAINALNGGGSYTPAPVNTSQDSAPQMQTTDLSALSNIAQIASAEKQQKRQLAMQEKLANAQIKANKDEAEAQRKHEIILADTQAANQTQNQYIEYQKHQERLKYDYENAKRNWRLLERQVIKLEKETKYIDVQITGAQLDNVRKQLENDNYPTLARLANEKTQREINALILDYNQCVENHTLDTEEKRLRIRFEQFTQDNRIDAENLRNELEAYMNKGHLEMNSTLFNLFGTWELIANNYMPALFKGK